MLKLLALMFLVFVLPPDFAFAGKADQYVDTAVVFVVDVSISIDEDERAIGKNSHAEAMQSREVVEAIQDGMLGRSAFAYVEFSSDAITLVPWRIVDGPVTAAAFSGEVRQAPGPMDGGLTSIGAGLFEALRLLEAAPFRATREVVDIVGDGPNNTKDMALSEARKGLLARGTAINGMPMLMRMTPITGYTGLVEYFAKEVVGGPSAFVIPLEEISQMPMLLRQKLALELF